MIHQKLVIRSLIGRLLHHHHPFQHRRTFYDFRNNEFPYEYRARLDEYEFPDSFLDEGLEHAVESERQVQSVINLKEFILSDPSKCAPLSTIYDYLGIPPSPIKYPSSIFKTCNLQKHDDNLYVKLTPEALSLSSGENLLYRSADYKQEVAERIVKLLMLCRTNRLPIRNLDLLRWELGLPWDYKSTLIPEFPYYFRVTNKSSSYGGILELVSWRDELAASEMEKNGKNEFCLNYSKGLEVVGNYKKGVDEWQKLPYISPYTDAKKLMSLTTDELYKWVLGVFHEVLALFVGKTARLYNMDHLSKHVTEMLHNSDRSGRLHVISNDKHLFQLLCHPGIFYVTQPDNYSNKRRRVVLKEACTLADHERHLLMKLRFKYADLMMTGDEGEWVISLGKKINYDEASRRMRIYYDGSY